MSIGLSDSSLDTFLDRIHCADARELLPEIPDAAIHLIITSPPYWNVVDYGNPGQIGQCGYREYLHQLLQVWREAQRILIPNGKLCIVSPIMPLPKSVDNSTHTRKYLNLNNDIEAAILSDSACHLERFSLYVWQKQTSVKMFGSYPYPPNIYEDNTVEFINVLVKRGRPRKIPKAIKQRSRLSQAEWLNLTMQVWPIYPEDVRRAGGHPCPFPTALAQRLIAMYTFGAVPELGFPGDVVLDMFAGTGATCLAAKSMQRRYIGIDVNPEYCEAARKRLHTETVPPPQFDLPRPRVTKKVPTDPSTGGVPPERSETRSRTQPTRDQY